MSEFHGDPIKWPLTGKMSCFGGPDDKGVSPSEGLAVVFDIHDPRVASLFLPKQPHGTTGSARRLNPNGLYIAMRWNYGQTPRDVLLNGYVIVTNSKGDEVHAKPVDWGPNEDTGRICDLSPSVLRILSLKTDDIVTCTFVPVPRHV